LATGGPIFIIGCPGSGTGLLRLVLNGHERIAVAPETGFMRAEGASKFIPFWPYGGRWYRRLGLTEEQLDDHLREFYEGLFRGYAEREGKQRWGESTPWHVWHVDEMARLFPDAVFAGVVRHPGGNVVSNVRRLGLTLPDAAEAYARINTELVRQAAAHGDRFALVRYEDIVLQPELTLRELLGWLGEPWAGDARIDTEGLDAGRVARWTRSVGETRRARLESLVGPLVAFFGYTLGDPHELASLGVEGRLLRGSEVGARLAHFPGLDAHTRPPVPLSERRYSPREVELRAVAPPPDFKAPPLPPRPSRLRRVARPLVLRLPRRARRALSALRRRLG
jgi:hypothetical protein